MTEWSVVLVLATLVGIGASIVKPIISLTKSIVTLTAAVDGLKEDLAEFRDKNSESHERLWRHNEKQDARLDDHERRITRIEGIEGK